MKDVETQPIARINRIASVNRPRNDVTGIQKLWYCQTGDATSIGICCKNRASKETLIHPSASVCIPFLFREASLIHRYSPSLRRFCHSIEPGPAHFQSLACPVWLNSSRSLVHLCCRGMRQQYHGFEVLDQDEQNSQVSKKQQMQFVRSNQRAQGSLIPVVEIAPNGILQYKLNAAINSSRDQLPVVIKRP